MGRVIAVILAFLAFFVGCAGSGQQEQAGFSLANLEPEHAAPTVMGMVGRFKGGLWG